MILKRHLYFFYFIYYYYFLTRVGGGVFWCEQCKDTPGLIYCSIGIMSVFGSLVCLFFN